ncbi:MAG: ATP-binding protein, partial [Acidimicrobiia bacterium]|nr:ATP-binding protein [Acidimicrobiia bacterium]
MSGSSTDVAYLTRALKMPRARQVAESLAETARSQGWDYTEFLAKVLSEEVASRETHGGENRVKAARFPQTKTLDDFDFSHQRSVSRPQISHLHQLDFLREAHNVIFLGPPGTGKTHLSIALGVQAARRGYRVAFATATEWVMRLGEAKRAGRLADELE